MRRKDFTLKDKIDILTQIKTYPKNTSVRELEKITKIPKSTISRFLNEEKQLYNEWMLQEGKLTTPKRKRDGKEPNVEEALDQWFSLVSNRGVCISGPILKAKAEELAKKFQINDFLATDGWLSRWKVRRNIKFKKIHGEKSGANYKGAEEWKKKLLPVYLKTYNPDDIYNADETGLYFRATPDGSLCYKHIALSGYKKCLDRITVLCCTNMSGSDKLKLLIIGKASKPRCFKGLRIESLPVKYYANKNAWMTSEIFRNWLTDWDFNLQHEQRKILLLVDNCTAHPHLDNLKNIQLEYLPTNTTSLVQPMDMGIIKNLKTLYRTKLVNYILDCIDENLFTSNTTAMEISSKISILQAIHFVADSWRALKISTIQNCFSLCGLKVKDNTEPENVGEYEILEVKNGLEFATIDNNLPCYDENCDLEDIIIENIRSQNLKPEEYDDSDEEDVPIPVTNKEAKQCIQRLIRYFMQNENAGSPLSEINICADFVDQKAQKSKRQTTLDKYLHKNLF